MNFSEDSHPLAEFYPDARVRSQLLYTFAHRFLPRYAHDNPFNFVQHDGVDDVSRFIQARWQMFEKTAGLQPLFGPPGQMIFRRVTDLLAWAQDVAEHPAVFIQMPTPEGPACAFFVGVVLLAPLGAFKTADVAINLYVHHSGPAPDESLLAPLRAAPCRFFTLERSVSLEGAQALQVGGFCEWTREGDHCNTGLHLPANREAFGFFRKVPV
jgi:hypothetical protein